jgi:protein TonB
MTSPLKFRSKTPAVETGHAGMGVNDNVPGHELSDLVGVPRQPAAEAVIHYGRVTQIASFPVHPDETSPAATEAVPMDATPEALVDAARPAGKRLTLACLCSIVFHVAIVVALAVFMVAQPEEAIEEAGEAMSVVMLGDSDMDQKAAGEKQPEPEQITAEAVQPETVQAAEPTPEETQPVPPQPSEPQPVETAQTVQPSEPPQEVSPQTVESQTPEVLTSVVPAETAVDQAVVAATPPETVVQSEVEPPPVAVQPTEIAKSIEKKPVAKPPVEKPKEVAKKQPPKKEKEQVQAGSAGQSAQDSQKGVSEGQKDAKSNSDSRGAGGSNGVGTAADANYLGKISARLTRCVRRLPSEYKRAGGSISVRLVVDRGGSVASASIAGGSGMPDRDRAALDLIRACDLPPLPSAWEKPTRSFTQEILIAQ